MNYIVLALLIFIIILGFTLEKSKGLSYAIMGIMFVLICFSYDNYDRVVYSDLYEAIGQGGESPYEFLFTLSMKIGNFLGLNYFQYRMVVAAVSLLLINSTIQKFCPCPALAWALFIIYPGWIITTLMRHMLAFGVMVFGLRYFFSEKKSDIWKCLICIIIAAFIHNAFWMFLVLLLVKNAKPKKVLIASLIGLVILFALGETNLMFKLFALLPTREGYVDKYMTGAYSNLNGIIYNCLRQCVVMTYGCFAVYMYRQKEKQGVGEDDKQTSFMNVVLVANCASVLILGAMYYTMNASRLYHTIMLINTIAWGVALASYKRKTIYRQGAKWGALAICLLLSFLLCTMESPTVFEYVLQMHFETNDLINFFNDVRF